MSDATVFVANTNRSWSVLEGSDGSEYVHFDLLFSGEDFEGQVRAKQAQGLPLHNLVAAWACNTLYVTGGITHKPCVTTILIEDGNGILRTNSAYLGFNQETNVEVWTIAEWTNRERHVTQTIHELSAPSKRAMLSFAFLVLRCLLTKARGRNGAPSYTTTRDTSRKYLATFGLPLP